MTFTKQHMQRVSELPCGVCGAMPVELHHILEGRTPGRKSDDRLVIPLCNSCHVHPKSGVHGMRVMWNVMKKSELDVLAETIEKIYGGMI